MLKQPSIVRTELAMRGRTRSDLFIGVWDEVQGLLRRNAGLEAKTPLTARKKAFSRDPRVSKQRLGTG
jgi:hypothetical protein